MEKQFKTIYVLIFTKGGFSFKRFNCNREWIPDFGAATDKARLPILRIILERNNGLETGALMVLKISRKCNRLTKYVGC